MIETNIDATPVFDSQYLDCAPDQSLDAVFQLGSDFGGANENLEGFVRLVPNPFGLVGVDRSGSFGKLGMVDFYYGKDFQIGEVSQNAYGKLSAGQKLLDNDRLLIQGDNFSDTF